MAVRRARAFGAPKPHDAHTGIEGLPRHTNHASCVSPRPAMREFGVGKRRFRLIGAPLELGSRTPGSALAPDALRTHGLDGFLASLADEGVSATDLGNVVAPGGRDSGTKPRNLAQLATYSRDLMFHLAEIYGEGACPIVVGGDHSVSIPSVSAAARFVRDTGGSDAQLGLIWVDAHPDLETPDSSPSGYLHGMSVAALLGLGAPELVRLGGFSPKVRPANVAFIGLRDVLRCERDLIESHGMVAYAATDIDRMGMGKICDRVFGHMEAAVSGFVLSFDVDACDPSEAPGVEYPERGGLTLREARLIAEYAAEATGLLCVEVVEVNPELDHDARSSHVAVSFIKSVVTGRPVRPSDRPE
jgi:arginase